MSSPTHVYQLREDGCLEETSGEMLFPFLQKPTVGADASVNANVIAALGATDSSREVNFLAGCSDGSIR